MDVTKIIKATAVRGRTSTAAPIIKEDYGLYLLINGIDLPEVYEVDFSNDEHAGTSVTMVGNADGVLIPNQFIKSGKDVFAFYYHVGEDFGRTVYKFRIPNKLRPDRTDVEPTPEEQSVIDQAISALNTAVAKTAQDVISADQSARSASDDADRAERARTAAETAQGKAEDAQESAERAKDDAETSERNASESERKAKGYAETASEKADSIHSMTASAQTLPAGSSASANYDAQTGVMSFGIPKGKDGMDGDDGYSPTANVSKSGKVATITITDKNGTTSAQVEDGEDGIDGISPSVSVTDITGGHRVVITDKDGTKSFDVEDGATGATPNLTIGTVETLEPTESATATITGTPENPVLNLGIPQGDAGEVTTEEFLKAFPTDMASGSIASFSDGADDLPLKSLVVDINPIQDLSHGDPSPENICPISGWTSVDVEQSGVNVWDEEWEVGGYAGATGNVWNTTDRIRSKADKYVSIRPNTTYFVLMPTSGFALDVCFYDADKNFISHSTPSAQRTFTTPENACFMRFATYAPYGTTYNHDISINYPSTDHDHHPYTGRSITISLGQTVYGGHLDVISGVLTVDRAMVTLDGSADEAWSIGGSGTHYRGYTYALTDIKPLTGYTTVTDVICDRLKSGTWNNAFAGVLELGQTDKAIGFGLDSLGITSTPNLNSWLAENPLTVAYPLATPITIQLTPQQVNSLYEVNNLWADSGDTEVEYRADTKLFIERLTAPDSADMVADANITSGQYFMVGNNLYKATANIANGSAIIVGTNCIRKSLSEALNEINA